LRTGAGVGLGILPAPAAAISAEVGLAARSWRVGVGVGGWFPRQTTAPTNPDVGGSFSLWSIRPRGCGVPVVQHFSFPLCLGVEFGAIRGTGVGALTVRETASAFWSAAQVSGGAMWQRGRWGLWLDASVLVSFLQPAFRTVQTPLVFAAGRFGGAFAGGVEVRFP